jgi:hypothetical protein
MQSLGDPMNISSGLMTTHQLTGVQHDVCAGIEDPAEDGFE